MANKKYVRGRLLAIQSEASQLRLAITDLQETVSEDEELLAETCLFERLEELSFIVTNAEVKSEELPGELKTQQEVTK